MSRSYEKFDFAINRIFCVTLGIWLIYNEYSFRRRAVAVAGRTVGFKRIDGFSSEDAFNYSFRQEVVFVFPFTNVKRRAMSTIGSGRQPEHVSNSSVTVYVLPVHPHRYRVGSPVFLFGGLVLAMGIIWLIATYFR